MSSETEQNNNMVLCYMWSVTFVHYAQAKQLREGLLCIVNFGGPEQPMHLARAFAIFSSFEISIDLASE